jgi:hypothetical protein
VCPWGTDRRSLPVLVTGNHDNLGNFSRGSELGRLTAKKAGLGALADHSAESGFCYTPHRLVTRARILQKRGPRRASFLWLFAILAACYCSQVARRRVAAR